MIQTYKNPTFSEKLLFLLLLLFPLSYPFGPFVINCFIFSIIFFFFVFCFQINNFSWLKSKIFLIALPFFLFIIFVSIIKYYDKSYLLKSLSNFRFLLFSVAIYFFFLKTKLKIFTIIISYIIFIILLCLDIIFQFIFKVDIFGYPPLLFGERYAGFFGKEAIAGGFIYVFGFINLVLLVKLMPSFKKFFIFLVFFLFLLTMLITGDRTPVVSFVVALIFSFFFFKDKKFFFSVFFISLFILLTSIFFNKNIRYRYINSPLMLLNTAKLDLFSQEYQMRNAFKIIENKTLDDFLNFKKEYDLINDRKTILEERSYSKYNIILYKFLDTQWGAHTLTALEMFKNNIFLGSGLRSFRFECHKYDKIDSLSRIDRCSTHPHNIYFEILSELGLIVFVFFLIFLFSYFKFFLKIKDKDLFLVCIYSIIFGFLFPKTSGSFFSTTYGTYFWYLYGISFFYLEYKWKKKR
jgi:O-antigen ligase